MSCSVLAIGEISICGMRLCDGEELRIAECVVPAAATTLLRQHQYSAVVCDLRLPDFDYMELLSFVRENRPQLPFVVSIEPKDLRHGLLAMIAGASGYLVAPDDPEISAAGLAAAFRRHSLNVAVGA
jgi:DNA-binding NarL/FixJ family response regulator